MTKKNELKKYLSERVNFNGLYDEWQDSWLVDKPKEWLYSNGLVQKYFNYDLIMKGLEEVGYKYPSSDRTWKTIIDIRKELIDERIFLM